MGLQVRDLIHPIDIYKLIIQQIHFQFDNAPRILNLGGGVQNTLSLSELNDFCKKNMQDVKSIGSIPENRKFDIPYYSTDFTLAQSFWNWSPTTSAHEILDQILFYGRNNIDHIARIN